MEFSDRCSVRRINRPVVGHVNRVAIPVENPFALGNLFYWIFNFMGNSNCWICSVREAFSPKQTIYINCRGINCRRMAYCLVSAIGYGNHPVNIFGSCLFLLVNRQKG